MPDQPKLITTDITEFLKDEYEQKKVFQSTFRSYEEFEKVMSDAVRTCKDCGAVAWKDCSFPCDCQYQQTLKH